MIIEEFGDPAIFQVTEGAFGRTMSLHEAIAVEMATVTLPLDDAVEWVREHVTVRPGFREFAEQYRPVILSSGFTELIAPVLEREGVSLEVDANRVDVRADGIQSGATTPSARSAGRRASAEGSPPALRSSTSAMASQTIALRSPPTACSRATSSSGISSGRACHSSPSRTSFSSGLPSALDNSLRGWSND
jgi:hypothetical protein